MQADLKIELGRGFSRLGDRARVVNVVGHRRFAVHVFSGLESRQHDFPVLMRRRGDDYGLDVFVREQLGVRRVSLRLGRATEAAPQISRVRVSLTATTGALGIVASVLSGFLPQMPQPTTPTLTGGVLSFFGTSSAWPSAWGVNSSTAPPPIAMAKPDAELLRKSRRLH